MKIVSDFDGVLTDQTEEAGRVRALFRDALVRLTALGEEGTDSAIARAEEAMDETPWKHGWWSEDRVTAFANEDLFIRNNALGSCLDQCADEGDALLRENRKGLEAEGFKGYSGLAQWAYVEMTKETAQGKIKPMEPGAAQFLRDLVSDGHEVVIVSNSGTDRIVKLLRAEGLEPSDKLRVRGDARKFELGDRNALFEFDRYQVELSRPAYETILREEEPSAVIGDVFSLDLALPMELGRKEPNRFPGMRLFLRERPYTPEWVRDAEIPEGLRVEPVRDLESVRTALATG